jgi:glycosyltransferase involved in cell wall biosynthesis
MACFVPTTIISFGNRRHSTHYEKAAVEIYPQLPGRTNKGNPVGLGFLPELRHADVIHCYQFNYLITTVTILAAALIRKPVFVTDLGGWTTPLSQSLQVARYVERFLNLSKFEETWTNSSGHSTLIFGGVNTDRFLPPLTPAIRDHFLYVGRLLPHKGIDVLIRAIDGDMALTIVGRPYDERYYQDLKSLAQGKRVRFITTANDSQLVDLYRTAIAVVLPSVYLDMYGVPHPNAEYLGLTLLEGMACGAAAICTAVGGMPEIVQESVTGFVVPPSDTNELRARLRRLLEDPALVASMSQAAIDRVRTAYTWHKVAERCLHAYRAGAAVD